MTEQHLDLKRLILERTENELQLIRTQMKHQLTEKERECIRMKVELERNYREEENWNKRQLFPQPGGRVSTLCTPPAVLALDTLAGMLFGPWRK